MGGRFGRHLVKGFCGSALVAGAGTGRVRLLLQEGVTPQGDVARAGGAQAVLVEARRVEPARGHRRRNVMDMLAARQSAVVRLTPTGCPAPEGRAAPTAVGAGHIVSVPPPLPRPNRSLHGSFMPPTKKSSSRSPRDIASRKAPAMCMLSSARAGGWKCT